MKRNLTTLEGVSETNKTSLTGAEPQVSDILSGFWLPNLSKPIQTSQKIAMVIFRSYIQLQEHKFLQLISLGGQDSSPKYFDHPEHLELRHVAPMLPAGLYIYSYLCF